MKLSYRLKKIAECINYRSVCDIGTDHGYLLIYMAQKGLLGKAAACDINTAPLLRANENISRHNFSHIIETRLGNGIAPVMQGEFECCVIAGVGGMLVIDILSQNIDKAAAFKQIVLSPQHGAPEVRKWLHKHGFKINNEFVVCDAGKWYNIIGCCYGKDVYYNEAGYLLGECLLQNNTPEFKAFLQHEINRVGKILENIKRGSLNHKPELENYLKYCLEAINEREN